MTFGIPSSHAGATLRTALGHTIAATRVRRNLSIEQLARLALLDPDAPCDRNR